MHHQPIASYSCTCACRQVKLQEPIGWWCTKGTVFFGFKVELFLDHPKSLSSGKITHTNIDKRSRNFKKTLNHAKSMSSSNHVLLPKHSVSDKNGCRQKLSLKCKRMSKIHYCKKDRQSKCKRLHRYVIAKRLHRPSVPLVEL